MSARWVLPAEGPDILASLQPIPTKDAVRGEIIVTQELFRKTAEQAMPHIVAKLAERLAWERQDDIKNVVTDHLFNRAWCEPIIESEIRKTVREFVLDMMGSSILGEMAERRGGFDA